MAEHVACRIVGPVRSADGTYEYLFVNREVVCSIPAMTDQGYFIIKGSEKAVMIQEVRLKSELFTVALPASCELYVEGAYVPTRVRMVDDSVMELDTSMIHRNVGVKSMGMYEVLTHVFEWGIGPGFIEHHGTQPAAPACDVSWQYVGHSDHPIKNAIDFTMTYMRRHGSYDLFTNNCFTFSKQLCHLLVTKH